MTPVVHSASKPTKRRRISDHSSPQVITLKVEEENVKLRADFDSRSAIVAPVTLGTLTESEPSDIDSAAGKSSSIGLELIEKPSEIDCLSQLPPQIERLHVADEQVANAPEKIE